MKHRSLVLACALTVIAVFAYGQSVRLNDSSDWWSINREDVRVPTVTHTGRELQLSNFSLAGITLGRGGFAAIEARLGGATVIERGDASTGRSQVCYTAATSNVIHVVFEFGEDESVFYLFSGGRSWAGSKYCVQSKRVSARLETGSGLRLGLSRPQVEAILGRPDAATANEFVYSREFRKRTTSDEFERMRKNYPGPLTDEEAHKQFDFYSVEQYIVARFANSRLVYLAVSVSGSAD